MWLKAYPAVLITLLVLDGTFIGVVAKDFYKNNIGHLMSGNVVWWAVIVFYLVYAVGLVYFAVMPAVTEGSWVKAALLGAAIGFLAYCAYDLTNQATLKEWPVVITVADIAWGTILSAAAATIGFFAGK